ncbi:MAG: AbrB/MazE/SpoVT family DNA-binding domain-containing protein [Candidatus Bathyarchaeia archaeon]
MVTKYPEVVTISLVTVYEKGKVVIPARLRKKYRIKKGMKILVDEDILHDQIILIPIPAGVDPLEHFTIKGKLSTTEPKEISGEEEAQANALKRGRE